MAKFDGQIGYVTSEEVRPGIWEEIPEEYTYFGEVLNESIREQSTENLNSDFTIGNRFSIMADKFAYDHYYAIRYIRWMGALWTVREVEIRAPRLLIKIGGLYNGPVPAEGTSDTTEDNSGE